MARKSDLNGISPFHTSQNGEPQAPKSDMKKNRRKRYKGGITSNPPKKSKKRYVGLDTFKVKQRCDDGKVRLKPAEKEDGIHSQQWALAIVPQPDSPLLSLPLELRQKIYTYVLHHPHPSSPWIWGPVPPRSPPILTPKKKGNCYINTTPPLTSQWLNPIFGDQCGVVNNYNVLSLLNKQTYLDVVGSSLLYRVVTLSFESIYMMRTFLGNMNPIHYTSTESLKLVLSSTPACPSIPPSIFRTIASLTNLKHLQLTILIDLDTALCEVSSCGGYLVKSEILRKWEAARWDLLKGMDLLNGFELFVEGLRVWQIPPYFYGGMDRPTHIDEVDKIKRLVGAIC